MFAVCVLFIISFVKQDQDSTEYKAYLWGKKRVRLLLHVDSYFDLLRKNRDCCLIVGYDCVVITVTYYVFGLGSFKTVQYF